MPRHPSQNEDPTAHPPIEGITVPVPPGCLSPALEEDIERIVAQLLAED